ncbi:MAG: serine/threonine-protein kinase, partial [Actinomycetota bacterium]
MTTTDLPAIDGIEILDVIGRGGQSTVYRGRRNADDEPVAVKVHDGRPAVDARRRFDRERTALGLVSGHPAVVSLLHSGETAGGVPYLVLELASGSLQDRVDDGPLGIDEATALAISLAAALDRAHRAGIVHRDVKPANVVRAADGSWRLADFGAASLEHDDATSTLQVSFGHTAPEVFDHVPASPAADVYALASTLFTLLTGEVPFARREGEAMAATVHRLATEAAPDLRRWDLPAPLARLVGAAMQRHPEDRPPGAWFFGTALESVRAELGLAPSGTTFDPLPGGDDDATIAVTWAHEEESGPSPTATRRPRRRRVLVALAALAGLGAVGAGAWAVGGSDTPDDGAVAIAAETTGIDVPDDEVPDDEVSLPDAPIPPTSAATTATTTTPVPSTTVPPDGETSAPATVTAVGDEAPVIAATPTIDETPVLDVTPAQDDPVEAADGAEGAGRPDGR